MEYNLGKLLAILINSIIAWQTGLGLEGSIVFLSISQASNLDLLTTMSIFFEITSLVLKSSDILAWAIIFQLITSSRMKIDKLCSSSPSRCTKTFPMAINVDVSKPSIFCRVKNCWMLGVKRNGTASVCPNSGLFGDTLGNMSVVKTAPEERSNVMRCGYRRLRLNM